MKNIAFIKFGGLSSGGTEVSFQNVAISLSKKYNVDYLYCDSAPYIGSDWIHPDTDMFRKKIMEESDVKLKKFVVEYKDVTTRIHRWINTDFWKIFDEKKYDLIFFTNAGAPEYPYIEILDTPLINIITVNGGVFDQDNLYKTILISNDSSKVWIKQGGNKNKLIVIPLCREEIKKTKNNFKKDLSINQKFIFGFHQREDDKIFSEVPLKAYKRIENESNHFLLLGGSKLYSKQCKDLNINNFTQLDFSSDTKIIDKFLNSLNVFCHGRKHGETMGLVLTEAMRYGIPVISHKAESNAQVEVIGNAGKVYSKKNIFQYSNFMKKLENNSSFYKEISNNAIKRYENVYSTHIILKKYEKMIQSLL